MGRISIFVSMHLIRSCVLPAVVIPRRTARPVTGAMDSRVGIQT